MQTQIQRQAHSHPPARCAPKSSGLPHSGQTSKRLSPAPHWRGGGVLFISLFISQIIFLLLFPAAPAARQITATDQVGRSILIPARPQRVVALAPSVTEIVFAVGRSDCLTAVTRYSDYPPEAAALPKIGSYIKPDLERILNCNPDLVIAVKDGNPITLVKRIEGAGIPVYVLDPKGLDSVVASVRKIGAVLNAPDKAGELAAALSARIDRVRNLAASAKHRPGVFLQIGVSPIVSVGGSTFLDELITAAGGRNLSAGPTPYPRYSREQVLGMAPEILVITTMAREEVFEKVRKEWESWPDMPAVKNGRIYLVNSNLYDRPAPRMVDALEELFRLIHPELAGPPKLAAE